MTEMVTLQPITRLPDKALTAVPTSLSTVRFCKAESATTVIKTLSAIPVLLIMVWLRLSPTRSTKGLVLKSWAAPYE